MFERGTARKRLCTVPYHFYPRTDRLIDGASENLQSHIAPDLILPTHQNLSNLIVCTHLYRVYPFSADKLPSTMAPEVAARWTRARRFCWAWGCCSWPTSWW